MTATKQTLAKGSLSRKYCDVLMEGCCQPSFDGSRLLRILDRHGCRDLEPGSGFTCQGSATQNPCDFTFLHVFLPPVTLAHAPHLPRPSIDLRTRQIQCFPNLYFFELCRSPRIQRIAYPQMPKIHHPNVRVLGRRHTTHTFGKDSAVKSATI